MLRLNEQQRLERLIEIIEEKSEHSYLETIKDAENLFKDLITEGLSPFEIVYVAHGIGVYHGDIRNTKPEE
jgi:hypothetical protein